MRWLLAILLVAACRKPAPERLSCASDEADFAEGLKRFYAFDVEAAEASFRKAAATGCASGSWGIALALGPNINVPMLPERTSRAKAALAEARGKATTPLERALVDAFDKQLDAGNEAYADAMRALQRRYPDDPDLAALTAAALLDLHPFAQWAPDGTPAPETPELVALLEKARAAHPEHVGLTHYYIHAIEASPHPERALDAARAIGTMMPAEGHLVHMPSHIFLRTGRYDEAAAWNDKAIAADAHHASGPLYEMYRLHNHHFLWVSLLWLGDRARAEKEAALLADHATPEMVRAMPGMAPLETLPAITRARFDAWEELLALPLDDDPYARAVETCLRVEAEARLHRPTELAAAEALVAKIPSSVMMGANTARDVLAVALDRARGEAQLESHQVEDGLASLRHAITAEDRLRYDEPPSWPLPTRELLADRLRELHRCADARPIYEEDLRRNPGNRWSTEGVAACTSR